jgi:hypothetical protein
MDIKKANPDSYYLECAFHNSVVHGTAERSAELEAALRKCFTGYHIVECYGQNGVGFASITIEFSDTDKADVLIYQCYRLASYLEITVEFLEIHRWVKVL